MVLAAGGLFADDEVLLFEAGSPWPAVLAISLVLLAVGIPLILNIYGAEIRLWWQRLRGRSGGDKSERQPCVQCGGSQKVRAYPYWVAQEKAGMGSYSGVQNAHGWVCDTCASARRAYDTGDEPKTSRRWVLLLPLALATIGLPLVLCLIGSDKPPWEYEFTAKTGPFVQTHHLPGWPPILFGVLLTLVVVFFGTRLLRRKKPGAKVVLACQGAAFREQGYRFGGQGWLTPIKGTNSFNGSEEFSAFNFQVMKSGWDKLESYQQLPVPSSEPGPSPAPAVAQADDLFRFTCGHCGKRLKGNANLCGKTITCPKCKQSVTVPVRL